MTISLKDTPVPAWRYDLATGMSGPETSGRDAPDARISAPAPAFIMAAAGRDAFRDLMGGGTLTIEGDEPLAAAFLEVLRIV